MFAITNFYVNNSESRNSARRHCLASCTVTRNGEPVSTLVIDYYTPLTMRPGFYAAFRNTGHVERQHPSFRVWLGQSLEGVSAEVLKDTLEQVAELWTPAFSSASRALQFVYDPRLALK